MKNKKATSSGETTFQQIHHKMQKTCKLLSDDSSCIENIRAKRFIIAKHSIL